MVDKDKTYSTGETGDIIEIAAELYNQHPDTDKIDLESIKDAGNEMGIPPEFLEEAAKIYEQRKREKEEKKQIIIRNVSIFLIVIALIAYNVFQKKQGKVYKGTHIITTTGEVGEDGEILDKRSIFFDDDEINIMVNLNNAEGDYKIYCAWYGPDGVLYNEYHNEYDAPSLWYTWNSYTPIEDEPTGEWIVKFFLNDEEITSTKFQFHRPIIQQTPFNPDAKMGKILIEDNMEEVKYLVPASNNGEAYINGKFSLDSTPLTTGYAYSYYSTPYRELTDFIIETDITPISNVEGRDVISLIEFRSNCLYGEGKSMYFEFTEKGGYTIGYFKDGDYFTILPMEVASNLKRGLNQTNRLKIVAIGPHYDFYINDEFAIAIEDYRYSKGGIGFSVRWGGKAYYDNVIIGEVK